MFMLSQDRDAMSRLRTEVATVLGAAPFTFTDFKRLPYTRMVFREGLRLYPPAAFLTRRALKADRFGRVSVPADSFVVVSPWLVHRHERHWQDAWSFCPERFADDQPAPKMGTYIPFGLGPRVCTGATIAQLEASLILAELLRRFEFRMTNVAEVFPMTRVTIRPRSGIACTVSTINSTTF
jgi:cytochrome P450